jgi:hypothetical protein
MSDLSLSEKMGVVLSSGIKAKGEDNATLTNFTDGCMDNNISLSLGLDFEFLSDLGLFSRENYQPPRSISGKPLNPQQRVRYNSELNSTLLLENNITIGGEKFLKESNGVAKIDILYNMEKLFGEPTNPIKVNFKSLELNSTNLEAKLNGSENIPIGIGAVDDNRTFYFARVVSYLKHYPETEKRVIDTPLFAEIFCKIPNNRAWCDETMNMSSIGMNISQKTDRGWYRARGHDGNIDGEVIALVSTNSDINITSKDLKSFSRGKVDNIKVIYNGDDEITATIRIYSDIWLGLEKIEIDDDVLISDRLISSRLDGYLATNSEIEALSLSSYTVTIKSLSSTTGAGSAGRLLNRVQKVEHNGKMSW